MASEASNTQSPAETAAESKLLLLLPTVLGHLWPAERVVVGLRVCKQLRRDLLVHCGSIHLVQKAEAILNDCRISEDFGRLPQNLMITLKWKDRNQGTLLLEVLEGCKALAHLDLSGNMLGDAGAGRLAGVLGECKGLAHLDLRQNMLGAEGAEKLAGALGECKELACLVLSGNRIGDAGGEGLAEALQQCKALAHLDLSGNRIGDDGGEMLAEALQECKQLGYLDLSGNRIGADGAGRLAGVLGHCTVL
eukprot:1247284-Rhodomonas_salina.1